MIAAHADVVGSLLRPPELLEAQEDLAAGRITQAHFKTIEDRAVDEAVALQEGRTYVIPDDVQALAAPILAHRLVFSGRSGIASHESARAAESVIGSILRQVPLPERAHQDR